ncbi:hypothetical protein Trydic_g4895 [Trypoxylus dichotomus]
MADNDDDLQRLLYRFQTKAVRLNRQISMEKIIGKETIRSKLTVNDKLIGQCMECTHLGVEMASFTKLQQEVRTQINQAPRISGYLRDPIWSNEYICVH